MLWIAVLGLLLLPTAAGRVLLDVAGGLVLVLLALPLILGGVGWLGWKVLQSRMTTCGVCGTVNFSPSGPCQMCGNDLSVSSGAAGESQSRTNASKVDDTLPASAATIDISAEELD